MTESGDECGQIDARDDAHLRIVQQGTSKTAMESQKVSPVALKMCRAQLFNALASGSWAMMQIPADTEGSVRYDKIQWVCYAK